MDSGVEDLGTRCPPLPPPSTNLPPILQLSAGAFATCGVFGDGSLRCWGRTLGDVAHGMHSDPRTLTLPAHAVQVSVGIDGSQFGPTACVVLEDQSVWCWGDDTTCMFGDARGDGLPCPTNLTPNPVRVPMVSATQVSVGFHHVCAAEMNGDVQCWGEGYAGEVDGHGTGIYLARPTSVRIPGGASEVAAGVSQSCARTSIGNVYCWGVDALGMPIMNGPARIMVASPATHLTMSDRIIAVTGMDARVYAWGGNAGRILTPPVMFAVTMPVPVTGVIGAADLAVGTDHDCVITAAGGANCWGGNANAQLGHCDQGPAEPPSPVPGLSMVLELTAGQEQSCARTMGGFGWCWGRNDEGQTAQADRTPTLGRAEIAN
jgi:alpha-tubulin suppressor-like RCC1 family protein